MQCCTEHWQALRTAVADRGMDGLVARSGEQATEDLKEQLNGTETLANWDPLMAAHWAISGRVLEVMGLAALGDICPLCEVERGYAAQGHPGVAQQWIDGCMDAMLRYARENGLVPAQQ